MDIQFGNLSNLNLLWVVVTVTGVIIVAAVSRRRAWARFATANLVGSLAPAGSSARRFVKATLVSASLIALVLALLDIRWGKVWHEVPQKGIEVMFVLDVSRSMLAEDVAPNRLQRAKQQISDMLDTMAGDRVGLVAFAGDARQLVPLTSHYHDFKQTLGEVGPQDVDLGGSRLGDALQLAADGFLDQTGDHKAIVVFTDGEDQNSKPIKTAEQLHRDQGIRVFTVGLGDMERGARIPVQQSDRGRSYLQYHGQQVWSKMNGAVLKQLAVATGGAYIPAGTKQVDMAQVYHNYVAQVEQQDFETARINSYVPRYQWFVSLGLLLLLLDTLLPATRRRQQVSGLSVGWAFLPAVFRSRTRRSSENAGVADSHCRAASKSTGFDAEADKNVADKSGRTTGNVIAAACLTLLLLTPQAASAAEPARLVRQANEAFHAGNVNQALADYQQAAQNDPDRPELLYNQAVAHYRNGQYEQARQLFTRAASLADDQLDAKASYNLANCDYANAVQLADKDKPAAIERLPSAISHYRDALAADSADTDARANAQLAQMLIDRLQQEEEQKKQQQQQQDQQKDEQQEPQQGKQQQEKQSPSPDQNKQDDENKQDQREQDEEKQDNQKQDEQNQHNEKQDQQNKEQPTEQNGESKDQSPDKPDEQQSDKDESAQQDKEDKQEHPPDKQPQPAESQDEPAPQHQEQQPQPDAAQSRDSQPQPAAGQPSGTPQFGHDDATTAADAQPMTEEEAQKMLQAVRDRELMRRLQQQEQNERRRVPVDRDW